MFYLNCLSLRASEEGIMMTFLPTIMLLFCPFVGPAHFSTFPPALMGKGTTSVACVCRHFAFPGAPKETMLKFFPPGCEIPNLNGGGMFLVNIVPKQY